MKTIELNNEEVATKKTCMRTKIRAVCLEGLLQVMASDPFIAAVLDAKPQQSIWFVLDPESLADGAEPIEWRIDDLGSCFMLADSRCDDDDPRSIGAIQIELTFGTAQDEKDNDHDCEWTPWWKSLSSSERAFVAREFRGLGETG